MSFHFFYGVAVSFEFKRFAQTRNSLQAGKNESSEGLETGIPRKHEAVLGFQVADVDGAFEHQDRFVFERWLRRRYIELIFDVADQLLEDVFHRDHSGGGTELVDHDREMAAALLEFREQFSEDLGFGYDQHVMHDLADLHAGDA